LKERRWPTSPAPPKPTAAELDLLQALWPLGSATARQVHDAMVKERPDVTYATVLRLMQIMHGKGLLIRDESERSHVYAPAQAQESLQSNLLKDLMQRAFSGSAKALVLAALKTGISKKEREEIEKLLEGRGQAMSAATLVASLGWTLLHFVWQGALIACAAATLLLALRNARPETRYASACTALLLCLAWPAADLALMLADGRGPESGRMLFGSALAGAAKASRRRAGWPGCRATWTGSSAPGRPAPARCCCAWLLGLAWIGRAARRQPGDPAWQARLSALALRCGLTRAVRLRIVDG
jgi:predicted transcriptional regulator